MSYDNLAKLLAEKHPERFATWLLGSPQTDVEVLKTELSIEPIRADAVTFLRTQNAILHFEFQTRWASEPPIDFRMLDYWVRLYRLYRMPIVQVVVLLLPPSPDTLVSNIFEMGRTRHEYQVLKLWEVDPEILLNDPILLPFASLASQNPSEELLRRVAAEVDKIEAVEQRRDVASYVQVIAGLRFSKTIIQRLFQEDMMRESVIYQDILQKGEDQGIRQGLERELELVYRQLTKKLGALPGDVRSTLATLSIERLELLGVDLFDFEGFADFQAWLAR